MQRSDRFVLSHKQYAVDLNSLALKDDGLSFDKVQLWHGKIRAVWYRRRRGVTVACVGKLWDIQRGRAPDAVEFLIAHDDGRYNGSCEARWDGKSYWGTDGRPEVQAEHLALLRPMWDSYPAAPYGYDGWWRF